MLTKMEYSYYGLSVFYCNKIVWAEQQKQVPENFEKASGKIKYIFSKIRQNKKTKNLPAN